MVKFLVILACVLGAVSAGRIPVSNDRISWQRELQRQNVRPTLMDLVRLRWSVNPWVGLQLENRGLRPVQVLRQDDLEVSRRQNPIWGNQDSQLEDNNERIETELEERYSRVPINREVLDDNLPTSDANSNRLLHVGRRHQQQLNQQDDRQEQRRLWNEDRQGRLEDQDRDEDLRRDNLQSIRRNDDRQVLINRRRQEEMTPLRINRIEDGRLVGRVGPMSEEDILQLIRWDNRMPNLSDDEILEIQRRQRQEKMERRRMDQRQERDEDVQDDDLQSVRRDDERLVHINRRRLDQIQEELTPRRINRIEEGRRVEERGQENRQEEDRWVRRRVEGIRQDNEQDRLMGRRVEERVEGIRQETDGDRLMGRRVEGVRQETDGDRLMGRRVEERNEGIRQDNEQDRLMGRRVEERVEGIRQETAGDRLMGRRLVDSLEGIRQDNIQDRLMGRRLNQNVVDSSNDNLQSVRRDDPRLVHINRRRLGQGQEEMTPRRIVRIEEGRRVGDVDTMTEQDILQFIRRDNRLTNLNHDEIIEMLRRNRQRKEEVRQERMEGRRLDQEQVQRNENGQLENLQSVRRDDERLVHINRRRLGQNQEEMTPLRVNRIGEGRRVQSNPMSEQDILKLIRKDNRLNEINDEDIIEMIRRQRQENTEGRRLETRQERVENVQPSDDLQSVRRDDPRLVHVNRRRLGQTL